MTGRRLHGLDPTSAETVNFVSYDPIFLPSMGIPSMTTLKRRFLEATKNNDGAAVQDLLQAHGDELEESKAFALGRAAALGATDSLQVLVDNGGCDVNDVDSFGYTPLQRAAAKGHGEAVRWLVSRGAKVDDVPEAMDTPLVSPLIAAIEADQLEIVKLLLDFGADPRRAYAGESALQFAQRWSKKDVLELFGVEPQPRKPWVMTDLPDYTGTSMDDEKIDGIEKELGLHVPSWFRRFLIDDFPGDFFYPEAPDNDEWAFLGPDYGLFHTARSFIAYNSEDSRAETKQLYFPGYLAIGTNGGGDSFCISLNEDDGNVYFYDHECDEMESRELNLEEHVQDLRANGWGRDGE